VSENQTLYVKAVQAHKAGQIADAEKLYQVIVADDPGHADALHMLGVIATGRGRTENAYAFFRDAVASLPGNAGFLNNLGVAARALGKLDEALEAFQGALVGNPHQVDVRCNLGNALLALGQFPAAIKEYREVLAVNASHKGALNNLGIACREVGDLPEALAIYQRLVAQQPGDPSALSSLGAVQMEMGETSAAIEHYRQALTIDEGHQDALNNLGVAYIQTGQSAEAHHIFERLLERDPKSKTALDNLGTVLRRMGRTDAAAAAYRAALLIAPDDALRLKLATLSPVIAVSGEELNNKYNLINSNIDILSEGEVRVASPDKSVGVTQFHLSYHDKDNRSLNSKIAQLYLRACPSLNFVAPHCSSPGKPADGRLRVGFISKHFRDHAVGWCYQGIMRLMPKEKISVSAFTFGNADDDLWRSIVADVDDTAILPSNLALARAALAEARLDILIYTDIGMDPLTYFLAFSRLAPVQCVTNGHPDTTGIPNIDYFISSAPLEPADAANHYSEKLAALEDSLVYYRRPAAPPVLRSRTAFDLPESSTLYLCPQSLFKFHPEMDAAFAEILEKDDDAILAIFEGPEPEWSRLLLQRWRKVMGGNIKKVQVIKRQSFNDFLNILSLADVVLDTWPFGGGNTSYQCFALGVPIVTLPGRFARGRSTLALYNRMEIPDLIAGDWSEYVSLALRLGREPRWRQKMSDRILSRADVLFEDTRAVEAFAAFLISVGAECEQKAAL